VGNNIQIVFPFPPPYWSTKVIPQASGTLGKLISSIIFPYFRYQSLRELWAHKKHYVSLDYSQIPLRSLHSLKNLIHSMQSSMDHALRVVTQAKPVPRHYFSPFQNLPQHHNLTCSPRKCMPLSLINIKQRSQLWFLNFYIVPTSSPRDNITRVNHHILGIVHFGGRCFVIVLSLKDALVDWKRKEYINCHWSRLLSDVRLYW